MSQPDHIGHGSHWGVSAKGWHDLLCILKQFPGCWGEDHRGQRWSSPPASLDFMLIRAQQVLTPTERLQWVHRPTEPGQYRGCGSSHTHHIPRHIIITLPKIKEKVGGVKAAREKETVTYRGVPIRLSADCSKETLQARRGWKKYSKVMKGEDLNPRWLYPANLSFRMEGQVKGFPDKVKLKEFIITQPLLYEMLNGLI